MVVHKHEVIHLLEELEEEGEELLVRYQQEMELQILVQVVEELVKMEEEQLEVQVVQEL